MVMSFEIISRNIYTGVYIMQKARWFGNEKKKLKKEGAREKRGKLHEKGENCLKIASF